MKDQILSNLDNPRQLERLYRQDKPAFARAFKALSPDLNDHPLAAFWRERLDFTAEDETAWWNHKDLIFVITASLAAFFVAKLPAIFSLDEEFFYSRNIGFIAFLPLMTYFAWKNRLRPQKLVFIALTSLLGLLFINWLPDNKKSDTLILSCIHLVLFLWSISGVAFVGDWRNQVEKRLGFLTYNGELVVIITLMLIAGGLLTGVTIGLFSVIGLNIERLYFDYVVVLGLSSAPILGTYLTRTNPGLVGRVSPVIAKLFSPLVLVMLVTYLIAMLYAGKDPYNDRDFLMVFNLLLIGVMAIIFFSVAETSRSWKNKAEIWILFLLSIVTIVVNGIALSAIVFRISEWGITPNRAAVLGGNVLILLNLLLVAWQLYRALSKPENVSGVGSAISSFLPIYFLWTIVVTFVFPLLFSFR